MQEQIISFETAKLAKLKGLWQEIGFVKYDSQGKLYSVFENCPEPRRQTFIAPTQSQLQKWLRDEHGIYINIEAIPFSTIIDFHVVIRYGKNIGKILKSTDPLDNISYESYLENALKDSLKLIK